MTAHRFHHRALVLGMLRASGPLAKTEIAHRLGVSIPTVAQILADFRAEGVVEDAGKATSSGGRRARLYDLRTVGLRAVGVNIDQDRIVAVVSDLSGAVHAEASVHNDLHAGQEPFITALLTAVDTVLREASDVGRLAGIGVAVPTTIPRSAKGVFTPLSNSPWDGVDVGALLGDRYQLPVVTENRARAVAVGEYLFGAGQGTGNLLCLLLGTGLGAGILADGRLFRGGDGGSGVLGRMLLDSPASRHDQPPRPVNELVKSAEIVRAAVQRLSADGRAELGGVELSGIDSELIIDQAVAGDPAMRAVLTDVGHVLGAAVATALCVTDSDLVLVCGPTTRAGAHLFDPLNETLNQRAPFGRPRVRCGELGDRAGTVGAAALVLTDFVDSATHAPEGRR